jgi:hypothetical protein
MKDYMYHRQRGSAHIVVIVCLVVALVAALGWIFYQNYIYQDPVKVTKTTAVVKTDTDKNESTAYQDLRTNKKDGTGLKLSSKADVAKLNNVDPELIAYFQSIAGEKMEKPSHDGTFTVVYTIDRVYGKYAAGSGPNFYRIWGPKDGKGDITEVTGTQDSGFSCEELKAAKVPSVLVDGKCLVGDGTGAIDTYKQD